MSVASGPFPPPFITPCVRLLPLPSLSLAGRAGGETHFGATKDGVATRSLRIPRRPANLLSCYSLITPVKNYPGPSPAATALDSRCLVRVENTPRPDGKTNSQEWKGRRCRFSGKVWEDSHAHAGQNVQETGRSHHPLRALPRSRVRTPPSAVRGPSGVQRRI